MANREAFLPLETIRFCLWLLHLYSKSTICFEITGGLYIKKLVGEVNLKLWIIPCITDRKANCKIKRSRLKPRSSYLLIVGFHIEKSLHEKQPVVLYFNNNTHFLRLEIYIVYKWVVQGVQNY